MKKKKHDTDDMYEVTFAGEHVKLLTNIPSPETELEDGTIERGLMAFSGTVLYVDNNIVYIGFFEPSGEPHVVCAIKRQDILLTEIIYDTDETVVMPPAGVN